MQLISCAKLWKGLPDPHVTSTTAVVPFMCICHFPINGLNGILETSIEKSLCLDIILSEERIVYSNH